MHLVNYLDFKNLVPVIQMLNFSLTCAGYEASQVEFVCWELLVSTFKC